MKSQTVSKCYGYGRHSTHKQAMTREVQEWRCQDYWDKNLRPQGVEWGGFYYDKAKSGKYPMSEREHGRTVYGIARPGDHVVIAKMDRAFRNVADGIAVIDMFTCKKVTFHSLDLLIDTRTALGRFFRTVLLAVAELEREFASERTSEMYAYARENQLPYGHSCPIGWKIVGERPNKRFRIDPNERALAQQIVEMAAEGMSQEKIALWGYTQQGFPNKRQFTSREAVKWVINAWMADYPKIVNYKSLRKAIRLGEIALRAT